jgi:TRAP-type C4-dicarboxylate transport system permease small subunit
MKIMFESKKKNLIGKINESGAVISGIALLLMMFVGALDVFMGKVFNKPIPGTFEATEALMVISAFMAIAYNQQVRGHIKVELFTKMFSRKIQLKFELFSHFLSFAFFFLIAWQGWIYGLNSLKIKEYESGLIAFPIYPAKLLLAFGASMMVLQCLKDMVVVVRQLIAKGRL